MEELILHSFDTRVIALFLLHIHNKCNIKANGEAKQYMRSLSPQQFLEHIKDIHTTAFLKNVYHNTNQHISDYLKPPANGH